MTINIFSTAGKKVNFQLFLETCNSVFQPAHASGDKGVETQGQWPDDGVHCSLEQQPHPVGRRQGPRAFSCWLEFGTRESPSDLLMTCGVAVAKSLPLCLSITQLKELLENSVLLCFKDLNGLISLRCLRILFGFSLWSSRVLQSGWDKHRALFLCMFIQQSKYRANKCDQCHLNSKRFHSRHVSGWKKPNCQLSREGFSPADKKLSVELQEAWSFWESFAVPLALDWLLKIPSCFTIWI